MGLLKRPCSLKGKAAEKFRIRGVYGLNCKRSITFKKRNMFNFKKALYKVKKESLEVFYNNLKQRLDILENYAETTIDSFNNRYEDEKKKIKEHYEEPLKMAQELYDHLYDDIDGNGYDKNSYAAHFSGLNDLDADQHEQERSLEENYQNLADIFNKSFLYSVFSFLESQTLLLCDLCKKEFKLQKSVKDLKDKVYIHRYFNYLKQYIKIDKVLFNRYNEDFGDMRKLRNLITHNHSIIEVSDEKVILEIVEKNKTTLTIDNTNGRKELKFIKSKYSLSQLTNIREFFEDLIWAIDKKRGYKHLKKNLAFMLNYPDFEPEPQITGEFKVQNKDKIDFTFTLKSADYKCKISLQKSNENKVDFINRVGNDSNIETLKEWLTESTRVVFEEVFGSFLVTKQHYKVEIMIFT